MKHLLLKQILCYKFKFVSSHKVKALNETKLQLFFIEINDLASCNESLDKSRHIFSQMITY